MFWDGLLDLTVDRRCWNLDAAVDCDSDNCVLELLEGV